MVSLLLKLRESSKSSGEVDVTSHYQEKKFFFFLKHYNFGLISEGKVAVKNIIYWNKSHDTKEQLLRGKSHTDSLVYHFELCKI